MKLTDTLQLTTTETRPAVFIPHPIAIRLRKQYTHLQARSAALEADKVNAASPRADFAEDEAADCEAKPIGKAVAEETGGNLFQHGQIARGIQQVRDNVIGLLRTELRLRIDVAQYLERWWAKVGKAVTGARARLDNIRADIQAELVKQGYVDPANDNGRTPGIRITHKMIESHPAVVSGRAAYRRARKLNGKHLATVNLRETERLAGLSD